MTKGPQQLPRIAITMGDPSGVGAEVCLRALCEPAVTEVCVPLILGDHSILAHLARKLSLPFNADTISIGDWRKHAAELVRPAVIDFGTLDAETIKPGKIDAASGAASLRYLHAAIDAALAGDVAAIATGPIHKESIHAAGSQHIGHTEILAEATGCDRYLMMLTAPEITCSLVTAHVGLAEVPSLLSVEKIVAAMELTIDAMRKMRGITPRLCVCGLNPHAGEGGLMGKEEEERFIRPAIAHMQERGFEVVGPLPPDTAFLPSRRKQTDAYICMYHDQGLIPLKMLAFDEAINITLGLPIIRTSVDHGAAFDIAWQGVANHRSMVEAIRLAARLATNSETPPVSAPNS